MSRPAAAYLDMVKFPTPTDVFTIFNVTYAFACSVSHLMLLAFLFCYTNVTTYFKFGCFSSMMTGNFILMVIDIEKNEINLAVFKLIVIICNILGGTFLDCILSKYFVDRRDVFAINLLLLLIGIFITNLEFIFKPIAYNKYYVCIETIIMGSLFHWSSKLGYVVVFQTGNLVKLAEALFKYLFGYSQGGVKLRGDIIILLTNVISYGIGAAVSASVVRYKIESSVPLFVTFPFQLYFAGCFEKWGWFKVSLIDMILPTNIKDSNQFGAELKISNITNITKNPIDRETFDIDSSSQSEQDINIIQSISPDREYSNHSSRVTKSSLWIHSVRSSFRRSVMDYATKQEYLDTINQRNVDSVCI